MGINRSILRLALPSILANITVPIVGMADIAVAGHLHTGDIPSATLIGGIAVGSMLFDLLYWNFGFLRIGTGGLAAQAFGKRDMDGSSRIFFRATGIAIMCAAILVAIQAPFLEAAFMLVDCSPEVREFAERYFRIRIWAAPATLALMAFKGWAIGMQDGVSPMITDLVVNVLNIVLSISLASGFHIGDTGFDGIGFDGIAAGTVAAQYSGLMTAFTIILAKYRRTVFVKFDAASIPGLFRGDETRRFFSMNSDLFIRSLCFIGVYIGFTTIAAHYGDLILAAGSILMKIMMLFSYFTDGFAYAGEALGGKFIGAKDRKGLEDTVRHVFIWSMGIAVISIVLYGVFGEQMLEIMTSDQEVLEMCRGYLTWLLLMPAAGCAAFTWDGIYVGATASRTMRNAMLWALAGFFIIWTAGHKIPGTDVLHVLLAAYFGHLIIRTLHMTFRYRDAVLSRVP